MFTGIWNKGGVRERDRERDRERERERGGGKKKKKKKKSKRGLKLSQDLEKTDVYWNLKLRAKTHSSPGTRK